MIIKRELTKQIKEAASEFPVIAVVGPRQSGKTTLVQTLFPQHTYISLEDHDIREIALADPRTFLADYPTKHGLILDEIQHAPHLLSYIQTIVDREKKNGFFIITGSQNFLINQAVTQSLAGRIAILTLLPLSMSELESASLLPERIETLIFKGSYPKAHLQKVSSKRLYANYLRTYIERDVRQLKNIGNLLTFQKFMRLCATRIGQELNLSSLGNECGINHNTAKAWISLLEASYIIFLLSPYYKNFGKLLIKTPKLYFVDTGIACSLLKIGSAEALKEHYLRGGLVESFIIGDLLKQQHNLDEQPSLYFWRDKMGNELDCIIEASSYPIPLEIKASKTVTSDFLKGLNYWKSVTDTPDAPQYLVYGGSKNHTVQKTKIVGWQSIAGLIKKLG